MTQSLPRPVLVAAILVADVILLAAGWFLVVAPQRHHAATAAAAVTAAQAQIQAARSHPPAQAAPAKQPAIHTGLLYRIEKAMPDTEDQPDLLLQIDEVAREAGVTVLTIAPGAASASATGGYSSIPIQLSVQGDFYGLTDLLYRLRTLVAVHHGAIDATGRLFAVDSVQLTPLKGKQLSADISVEAFAYGTATTGTTATTTTGTTSTGTTSTTTTTTTSSTSG